MKCKFCKHNSITSCSKGVFPDDYFSEYQDKGEIGCSSGSPKPDLDHHVPTKEEILQTIQEAIDKYDEQNMLVDVMYWVSVRNQIQTFLI